jgi:hypothetical protein
VHAAFYSSIAFMAIAALLSATRVVHLVRQRTPGSGSGRPAGEPAGGPAGEPARASAPGTIGRGNARAEAGRGPGYDRKSRPGRA